MRACHILMISAPMRLLVFAALALPICAPAALAGDRSKAPASEKWDLTDIFPSDQAWVAAKNGLSGRLGEIDPFRGRLGESPQVLLDCLDLIFDLRREFGWIRSYASLGSDLDTRDAHAMEMRQSLTALGSDFASHTSWIDPEILSLPEGTIERDLQAEPGLIPYKPVLEDTLRLKAHTLSPAEENLMAASGLATGVAGSVYSLFSNADLPRATVTLSTGEEAYLDAAGYTKYRGVANRWDREQVFQAFFGNLRQFRGTFGALLNGQANSHLFLARARHYPDCLSSALTGPNIPVDVYHSLIRNVRKNLPTLWRYLKLRQRIMGLDQLRYSDLYASIVKDVDVKYTVAEAQKLLLEALKVLGQDYVETVGGAFDQNWIDWHPAPGKRSGAYSNGSTFGCHPFILLNFTGTYEEVSTVAHEMGHAMHSRFSNATQPFPTADYTIFVAEVASTCNEHLLMDYMLRHTDDPALKLFLLGNYVDGIRQTFFRQAQFAEFELGFHRMVESGQALTGENLTALYQEILDAYYGVDQGICAINPACYVEWAYIPHFYYNYYVYSYSTSITASTAISQMIRNHEPGAVERYREFLSLGSSRPPVEELKVAGVDMTTDQPYTAMIQSLENAMDQMEAILDTMR